MSQKNSDDSSRVVELYDPHPGFAGAAIPIPTAIKKIAEQLDGQTMTIQEAVDRLSSVGIGIIRVIPDYQYIALQLKQTHRGCDDALHLFRVIRYR